VLKRISERDKREREREREREIERECVFDVSFGLNVFV
jgi:hypothetical protein